MMCSQQEKTQCFPHRDLNNPYLFKESVNQIRDLRREMGETCKNNNLGAQRIESKNNTVCVHFIYFCIPYARCCVEIFNKYWWNRFINIVMFSNTFPYLDRMPCPSPYFLNIICILCHVIKSHTKYHSLKEIMSGNPEQSVSLPFPLTQHQPTGGIANGSCLCPLL